MKVIAPGVYVRGLNTVAHVCAAGTVLAELPQSQETVVQDT